MENKFMMLLKSRKFWAAIVGVAFVMLQQFVPDFPIAEDQILNLVLIIVAYITGTAIEDSGVLRK